MSITASGNVVLRLTTIQQGFSLEGDLGNLETIPIECVGPGPQSPAFCRLAGTACEGTLKCQNKAAEEELFIRNHLAGWFVEPDAERFSVPASCNLGGSR